MLLQLNDDVLLLVAKGMLTPTSISETKFKERHFHDLWNLSRTNQRLHDLLWPPDNGYWQQMCAVHGSARLDKRVSWRRVALKLMREELIASKKVYPPFRPPAGFLIRPPDWAVEAIGAKKPLSPSFWDRPLIADGSEYCIYRTPFDDPRRRVMPEYRLLSMPATTRVEVILVCEKYKPGKILDTFAVENPDGLLIDDLNKAFRKWLPTATSANMREIRRMTLNNLTAIRLLEMGSTALLRTWPFQLINGGRVLAMIDFFVSHRYNPNAQIVAEVDNVYGEDEGMDEEDDEDEDEDMDEDGYPDNYDDEDEYHPQPTGFSGTGYTLAGG